MPKLKDIVGHGTVRREFEQDLQTGNVSHAYLLAGPRHLGKMTLARWFALRLLTADTPPKEEEQICHACERMTHPDLFVLDQLWIAGQCEDWETIAQTSNAPQQGREKKGVKTDAIGIDDIHALQTRLQETSGGRWRSCIIRSAERMTPEAAGAILKILEEPPAPLVFLFTTQVLSSLLPTVVSRMRVMRLHPLPHQELAPLLEGIGDEDRQFILHLAQGAPGVVQNLRSDPEALRLHRIAHTKAISFWKSRSLTERLQILEPLSERGGESDQILLHLALALRELSEIPPPAVRAYHDLIQGLKTNAHRGLLMQRFAFSIS